MKKVKASELQTIRMTCGNEKKYNIVIDEGKICQWVGIGWIELREPAKADYKKYPEVVHGN